MSHPVSGREKLKQDKQKQKHVKQDKKKVRKTPVRTHFQERKLKRKKKVTLKDRKNSWKKVPR